MGDANRIAGVAVAISGHILNIILRATINGLRIKDRDVRNITGYQLPSILDAPNLSRLGSNFSNGCFNTEALAVSDKLRKQVARIAIG